MNTYKATDSTGTEYTFNAKRDWTGGWAVIVENDFTDAFGAEYAAQNNGTGILSRHAKREAAVKAAAKAAGGVAVSTEVVQIEKA